MSILSTLGKKVSTAGGGGLLTKVGVGFVGVSVLGSILPGGNSGNNPISSVVSSGFNLLTGGNLLPIIAIGVAAYLFIR
jgi:hypothetical protein